MPTLREWIQKYKDKSPFPLQLHPADTLEFDEAKGFMMWRFYPESDMVYVTEVCGDIVHWVSIIKDRAKACGAKKVMALSKHDPAAYMKITGSKLAGHLFELEV